MHKYIAAQGAVFSSMVPWELIQKYFSLLLSSFFINQQALLLYEMIHIEGEIITCIMFCIRCSISLFDQVAIACLLKSKQVTL